MPWRVPGHLIHPRAATSSHRPATMATDSIPQPADLRSATVREPGRMGQRPSAGSARRAPVAGETLASITRT